MDKKEELILKHIPEFTRYLKENDNNVYSYLLSKDMNFIQKLIDGIVVDNEYCALVTSFGIIAYGLTYEDEDGTFTAEDEDFEEAVGAVEIMIYLVKLEKLGLIEIDPSGGKINSTGVEFSMTKEVKVLLNLMKKTIKE